MSSTPRWLSLDTEEKDTGVDSESGNANSSTLPILHGVAMTEGRKKYLWWIIKALTILLCFFQIVTALMGLTLITGIQDFGKVLTAIYM